MRDVMQPLPPTLKANPQLDRWVDFSTPGVVTLRPGKVEIGQGIVSAIAQMAAEELDVAYHRIRTVAVDTTISPNEGSTSGSRSVQEGGEAMRQACAEVRALFLQAAAKQLGVAAEKLAVKDGRFQNASGDKGLTYWQLLDSVDMQQPALGGVRPKDPRTFQTVGHALPRLDILAKVTGGAFIQDLELPNMWHARVVRPPSFKAWLREVDDAQVRLMPGVCDIVRRGSFLAVMALREEQAIQAMEALAKACVWEEKENLPQPDDLLGFLTSQPTEDELLCDVAQPLASVDCHELQATFTRPYLAHASIGPSCGVARVTGDVLEVWSHSQSIYALRDELAKLLQRAPSTVVVRHMEGSGCYGHNGADDVAFDAALLALASPGNAVRVQWMRDDEFAWEPLGPAMAVKLSGKVTTDGRVAEWHEEIWGNRHIGRAGRFPGPGLLAAWHLEPGIEPPLPADMPLVMGGGSQRNAVPYYDFAVKRVVNHAIQSMPIRVSALRALGAYINVFAIETFMDEMAIAADVDPIAFRLRHLQDARAIAVIEAVARMADWQPHASGDGTHGRGFAFARYKNIGNYAAVIAEVAIEKTVRVSKIYAAIDCGCIVNPDGVLNQIQGGIIQATSWVLKEEVKHDTTRITSRDWESYPILTFSEMPQMQIELINQPHEESLGVGEGVTGPIGPAIGNAIYNAMGIRVRDLPLTPERIVAAMND
jgi:CO/xanthine dehydrogenase Mo-binding subunit